MLFSAAGQVIGFVSIGPIGNIFLHGAPVDAWYPLNDAKVSLSWVPSVPLTLPSMCQPSPLAVSPKLMRSHSLSFTPQL